MLETLQTSWLATTIGQSQVWLASLSALHLVGFTLVMGSAVVANLGLMGALFGDRPATDVTRPAARMLVTGLTISLGTGVLMFLPRAESAAANSTFRLKLLLVGAGVLLQLLTALRVANGAHGRSAAARLTGASGLVLWFGAASAACAFILLE